MSRVLRPDELARFRNRIRAVLGLKVESEAPEVLERLLRERVRETACSETERYLERLDDPNWGPRELMTLAQRLTVGETYLFRNLDQLKAFARHVLPERIKARSRTRVLRFLSAGCASGDEAHTLAILCLEHVPRNEGWTIKVHGIDLDPRRVERARAGRFSAWALRQTPDSIRARYFKGMGKESRSFTAEFTASDEVRDLVSFETGNLLAEGPLGPGDYDACFFRNVAIYLSPDAIAHVARRIAASLAPRGYLFLGDAETLRHTSSAFRLVHSEGAFYYQLGATEAGEHDEPVRAVTAQTPPEVPRALDPAPGSSAGFESIERAAETPAVEGSTSTAGTSSESARGDAAAARETAKRALEGVHELLRRERFREALQLLEALEPEARESLEVRLLHAVLLLQTGDPERAQELCDALLLDHDLAAGAHYVKALCREHEGDRPAALEHLRAAIFLEPEFAMPRLHLGLLSKKGGDREGARRAIGRALELLATEDEGRILLFGGGFDREALVRLCRAELRATGGAA